ncbi:nuclear undecaprenyl pyrophosphate synthase-like protein [Leptodontidium sp. 2 PMI_412]|nr:nuclear undecaprenyl pyrophosphate synthase-like protein [Leptodontidium sp. MPI-SDFR-AT-0119]KAH9224105.1 nuclear undecaprenyl pyrophosphate synthase-like protein [Leptodontidium sp. 2 PMI_412]
MPRATRETQIYRKDAKLNHNLLTKEEREQLIKPYLPSPPSRSPSRRAGSAGIPTIHIDKPQTHSRLGVRKFLRNQLHALLYAIVHTIFSVYIRLRQAYHAVKDRILAILYYHHRTPELIQKDVKGLNRLPTHLSVILKLEDGARGGAGLEALVDEVAEISAWCACVGIPMLSIYEKTGVLKGYVPATHRSISRKLSSYFGPQSPALSLRAPHVPSMESASSTPTSETPQSRVQNLSVLLLSAEDGRDSLVDLTKTLAEMSQHSKLSPNDISIELVDAELSESVMGEPELLILFGPTVELSGYPPWQIRLTEIFHVEDNQGVGYQVFLRALYNFANAQMRFGR